MESLVSKGTQPILPKATSISAKGVDLTGKENTSLGNMASLLWGRIANNLPPTFSMYTASSPALGRRHSEGQEFDYESLWLLWPLPGPGDHTQACVPELQLKQKFHPSLQEPHGDKRINTSFFQGASQAFSDPTPVPPPRLQPRRQADVLSSSPSPLSPFLLLFCVARTPDMRPGTCQGLMLRLLATGTS